METNNQNDYIFRNKNIIGSDKKQHTTPKMTNIYQIRLLANQVCIDTSELNYENEDHFSHLIWWWWCCCRCCSDSIVWLIFNLFVVNNILHPFDTMSRYWLPRFKDSILRVSVCCALPPSSPFSHRQNRKYYNEARKMANQRTLHYIQFSYRKYINYTNIQTHTHIYVCANVPPKNETNLYNFSIIYFQKTLEGEREHWTEL